MRRSISLRSDSSSRSRILECAVFVIGGEEDAAVGEMAFPERIQRVELRDAAGARFRVARIDRRWTDVAECEQIGRAVRRARP